MRTIISATLLALLVACGGDKATGPNAPATVAGSYTLRTVNGNALPVILSQDAQQKAELLGGSVTLNSNNTWSGTLSVRVTDLTSGVAQTGDAPLGGTYSMSSGALTLTDATNDNAQLSGTISGNTLTITANAGSSSAVVLVFQK
jgi:hypothetical protein